MPVEPAVIPPAPDLRAVLFPKRGLSATELLLLVNLLVAGVLLAVWGGSYPHEIFRWAVRRWDDVHIHGAYGWLVPTLFLHANFAHLASNLLALLLSGGAMEFLSGARWTLAVYILTGLSAAIISYAGHPGPPLGIGASGAVMGLAGCALAFLIRRRRHFNYAQRWKVGRVYVPLFLLVFLPTLVNANVHAHVGGFLSGLVLGFVVPPHRRVAALAAYDTMREEEEAAPEED